MPSELLIPGRKTWIVVADESSATVYARASKTGPLEKQLSLGNEVARMKAGELLADRGGRSFDSHGQGRHTMAREKTGPKDRAAKAFAKTLAERINKAVQDGRCDEFMLIAAPQFLGALRMALKRAGNASPAVTFDKEMVGRDVAAIEKLLTEY